jgi:transposase InsO family protein
MRELSVAEQRYRAVLEAGAGVPVTEVAERYEVSRQSVHTWVRRYRQEGIAGLEDRSHRVHAHPWRIPDDLEEAICELRRKHPKWGPRRLVFEMDRRGHGQVTRSTVYRTLVRNGLIVPESRRRSRRDYRRRERAVPMELWQLDMTASAFLSGGTEVKIVTGKDDHSRFCVIATAVRRATARPVCQAFVDAMCVFGVPEEVLTDNGKVFTGRFHKPGVPVEVLFDRICRENGITHRLTKVRSPTTTGKIERLHQTLQDELLDVHGPFESIQALQGGAGCLAPGVQHQQAAPVARHGLPRQPVQTRGLAAEPAHPRPARGPCRAAGAAAACARYSGSGKSQVPQPDLESVKHHLKPNRQRSVGPRQGVLAGRQLARHPSGACVRGMCVLSRLMPPP